MEEVKRDRARRKLLRVTFPNVKVPFLQFFRDSVGIQVIRLESKF